MNNTASITSLMSSFGRAFHAENEKQPVFADFYARKLLTDAEYGNMKAYILSGIDFFAPDKKGTFADDNEALRYLVNTQIASTPLARARYAEECLKTAVMTGVTQYVIIGAGLDTFVFREKAFSEKYSVFEVDHPLTQEDKKERIRMAGLELPKKHRFVPCDLTTESLSECLLKAGFDVKQKTFFSLLGVSFYLDEKNTAKMLYEISDISADGSSLVFDYADEGLFESNVKRVKNMIAMAQAGGEPMKSSYSYEEIENLLTKFGLLIYEQLEPYEIQNRFFPKNDITLQAFEHIAYIHAVWKRI